MGSDLPDFYSDALFRVLLQRSFTERRVLISNNGATAEWDNPVGDEWRGKLFPRGCRGFIHAIEVYCRDAGTAGGTITVYISPYPTMGSLASANITVPAGGEAAWRIATFNRMWNYDSVFIYVVGSSLDIQHGYDLGTPYDSFYTNDAGATWGYDNLRRWFRVIMKALTPGDVPVSGTISTVTLPNVSTAGDTGYIGVEPGTTSTLFEVKGMGKIEALALVVGSFPVGYVPPSEMFLIITVDGDRFEEDIYSYKTWVSNTLNTPTPITFVEIDDANYVYRFWLKIPYEFQRSFKVEVRNASATDPIRAASWYWYSLRR